MTLHIVQLMASPFVGGPERQVLGLARALRPDIRTTFFSFVERGLARPFLERAREEGFDAHELRENYPHVRRVIREVADRLKETGADVLCCNGYKPDLLGWRAARRAGIPVLAIAHGWTGITLKVRIYEKLDALVMRRCDGVVCVSEAMASRVRGAGVPADRVHVIRNALDTAPFEKPVPDSRATVEALFPRRPRQIVGAVGRLSPEKGFEVLVEAAGLLCKQDEGVAFVVFGEGPRRAQLEARIRELGLGDRFVLAGFRSDLENVVPGFDVAALSSHTEGLPVAVLEAQAAGKAVVATAVGGTPEVVAEGVTGWLVPPNRPDLLADKLRLALADPGRLREMGQHGKQRIRDEFTFAAQADRYRDLLRKLTAGGKR